MICSASKRKENVNGIVKEKKIVEDQNDSYSNIMRLMSIMTMVMKEINMRIY